MKKFWIVLILTAVILIGLFFIFDSRGEQEKNNFAEEAQPKTQLSINGVEIEVAVADTPEERVKGLSGMDRIPFQGMLFIFDSPAQEGFWMKDMRFAIDIIWIGENFKVVDMKEGVKPETFPEIFEPREEAGYVLEVPAGFSKLHSLKIGSEVKILSNL